MARFKKTARKGTGAKAPRTGTGNTLPLFSTAIRTTTSRKARNKWTPDQRLTLHLIHQHFHFTQEQRTEIFNTIFAEQLSACGQSNGLGQGALTSQYGETVKLDKPSSRAAWEPIMLGPKTEVERAKRDLVVEQISRMAKQLGFAILRKGVSEMVTNAQEKQDEGEMGRGHKRTLPTTSSPVEDHLSGLRLQGYDSEDVPMTPTPKRSKRTADHALGWTLNASETAAKSDSDQEFVPEPFTKRTRMSRGSPEVVVPVTPKKRGWPRKEITPHALPTLPKTPKSSRRGPGERKPDAVVPYHYPSGNVIYLTQKEHDETQKDLVPVAESVAHPPIAGLLFRYWDDKCQSKLDGNGDFVAGRFATTLIPPPPVPSMQNFPWSDAAIHLNRDKIATPFVSALNNLTWILRLAIKEKNKGVQNSNITLIDPSQMDPRTVFHAQPFHRALCKKRPFENAAFMYHGMHEFMLYHKVPSKAIINTVSVDHLLRDIASNVGLSSILRLNRLGAGDGYAKTTLKGFKDEKIALDAKSITSIAHLARYLGLTTNSPTEQIMHVVSDVAQGWALAVSYNTPAGWSQSAEIFANVRGEREQMSFKDHQRMKLAFLDGVRWSRGDFNTRHTAEKMRLMLSRAKKIGLEDAAKILSDELNAARLIVGVYDQKQQMILQGVGSTQLLTAEMDDEEDVLPITPRSGGVGLDEDIVYDEVD